MHAELTLRGTTLMLGPENAAIGKRTAKSIGALSAGLYIYVENVDKVVDKATKLGATGQGPVMDMSWGDRSIDVRPGTRACRKQTEADSLEENRF